MLRQQLCCSYDRQRAGMEIASFARRKTWNSCEPTNISFGSASLLSSLALLCSDVAFRHYKYSIIAMLLDKYSQ